MAILLGVWLVCAFIGMLLLDSRGRAGTGFALGFFLGPIGLIIAAIMRLEAPTEPMQAGPPLLPHADERKCPDCAEWIKREARKCRFCGSAVEPIPAESGTEVAATSSEPLHIVPVEEPVDTGVTRAIGPVFLLLILALFGVVLIMRIWTSASTATESATLSSRQDSQVKGSETLRPQGKPTAAASKRAASAIKPQEGIADNGRVLIDSLARNLDSLLSNAVELGQLEEPPHIVSGEGDNGVLASAKDNLGASATIVFVIAADGRVAAARIRDDPGTSFARDALLAVAQRTYTPGRKLGAAVAVRMVQTIRATP